MTTVDLTPGDQLGPYEIRAVLGAGGMGVVYRAFDPRLAREVAVKTLPRELALDRGRIERFTTEAKAASRLSHPNIIAVYDVGEHAGIPYVVTELLDGETLRQKIEGQGLPRRKAIDLAIAVAHGLSAAHGKGIVHRDLKPENLFVTRDGRLKILDFGLAKLLDTDPEARIADGDTISFDHSSGHLIGTIGYMAPEQARGEPADSRADIFALGVICFEMLLGRHPFRQPSPAATLTAILRDDPFEDTLQSALPAELLAILRRCLEKSPDERFQSASDLAFQLSHLSQGAFDTPRDSASAPAAIARQRLTKRAARRLAAAGLGSLGLLLGLVAAWRGGMRMATPAAPEPPRFERLTFQRGAVTAARFMPDGASIVWSAAWSGRPVEPFTSHPPSPQFRALGTPGSSLAAVHPGGDLALLQGFRIADAWTASGTLTQLPFAGGTPRSLVAGALAADWSPDGKQLAVVRRLAGKIRLEYPTDHLLTETTGWFSAPRVAPTGNRLAVLEHPLQQYDGGFVVVYDSTGQPERWSDEWASLSGLAWSADGRRLFFSGSRGGTAHDLYELTGPRAVPRRRASSTGSLLLMDVGPGNQALVTRLDDRTELRGVRRSAGVAERELSFLDWSRVMDISDDGERILFVEQGAGAGDAAQIYVRDWTDAAPVRLGEGQALDLSADGQTVLYTPQDPPYGLALLPVGPGSPRRLRAGRFDRIPWATFFPDATRVLLRAAEPGGDYGLWMQSLDGEPTPFGPPDARAYVISPDGQRIVISDRAETFAVISAATGEPLQSLPGLVGTDQIATWSSDGASLLFYRPADLPPRLYRYDLASGQISLLRELATVDPAGVIVASPLVVTADGEACAYSLVRFLSDLYRVDLD
jgi:Tol biopolymer transport system component